MKRRLFLRRVLVAIVVAASLSLCAWLFGAKALAVWALGFTVVVVPPIATATYFGMRGIYSGVKAALIFVAVVSASLGAWAGLSIMLGSDKPSSDWVHAGLVSLGVAAGAFVLVGGGAWAMSNWYKARQELDQFDR